MAALSAMDHGRRQLWRLVRAAEDQRARHLQRVAAAALARRQLTLPALWAQAPAVLVGPLAARASALAVADFWSRLSSFATLRLAPEDWLGRVGENHPFLCDGGWRVRFGGAVPPAAGHDPVVVGGVGVAPVVAAGMTCISCISVDPISFVPVSCIGYTVRTCRIHSANFFHILSHAMKISGKKRP